MTRNLVLLGVVALAALPVDASEIPFSAPLDISSSALGARWVATGDLDGDGDVDALSASITDSKIAWYKNKNGDGSLWTAHTISTAASAASSVAVGDVDGDGDLDVLSASAADDKIAWYANTDGAGTFGLQQIVSILADGTTSVSVADIDGDGDLDAVAAAAVANSVQWFRNLGGGASFSTHNVSTSITFASSVSTGDVDGDGDPDVLSAGFGSNAVFWHANDGSGSFAIQSLISGAVSGALGVFGADVDGDGDLDAVSAASTIDRVAWHENLAGGGTTWSAHTISNGADNARAVYAADLDADGDADVLSASSNDDEVSWYENLAGAGTSWQTRTITTAADQAYSVAVADVDGDGDADVLSASSGDNTVAWYDNRTIHRSALFVPVTSIETVEPTPTAASLVDLDRDGDLDVVSCSTNLDRLSWYENTAGDGSAWTRTSTASSADGIVSVATADIDGDGDADLVAGSIFDDEVSWYPNRLDEITADFGPQQIVGTTADEPRSVFAADVDGDGDVDLLSASIMDDRVAWWDNLNGDGSVWTMRTITVDPDGAGAAQGFADKVLSVFAADLDGDGDTDVLSASENDDKIAWYENLNGAGTSWTPSALSVSADLAADVFAADLDGDGDADALSASRLDGKIAWYENRLNTSSDFGAEQVISSTADGALSVAAADLDLDGDFDVVSAAALGFDAEVAWYENRLGETAGDFAAPTIIASPAALPNFVTAGDIDGDGDPDVVRTGFFQPNFHEIAWHENVGGQFALATADTAPASLPDGESDDLLAIVVTHRGRTGDTDLEPATFQLLFEESPGDPLTTTEANLLVENLLVYHDSGSGQFEPGSDTLVTTVGSLLLFAGVSTVTLPDGHAALQVAHGTPETYFVVVELAAGASAQSPDSFRVTHLTETSSSAEDRDHDIPLGLEFAAHVASGVLTATASVSGEVPDGDVVPGAPLRLTKTSLGTLRLTWDPSCLTGDTDYEVYEGTLGAWTSHAPRLCTTGGQERAVFIGPAGSAYYLIAPRNTTREGSLGRDSSGTQRPPGTAPCLPRSLGTCP